MSKHIGIVACSAEGAALCYRTICQEGAALLGEAHAHPEISMHTPSLADYMSCLEKGDLEGVASLMLDSSHKLQATGADFLICPDNTIHQAMGLVLPTSPLPWLQIADAVAEAARALGNPEIVIALRHVLPNSLAPALIQASVTIGFAILLTAGLSFVGAGVRPPAPEWGLMISSGANQIILGEWWSSVFPGIAISLTVLSVNYLGDGLRDALDPRIRGR